MEEVLDQPLLKNDVGNVNYGGFWVRLGALIIDGLILAPASIGLTYLNIVTWKSSLLFVIVTLITTAYKPIMELLYGATLGKMAFRLKVLNTRFETASTGEILLRNVFHIAPNLVTLFFTLSVYQMPDFENVSGYGDYTAILSDYAVLQGINIVIGLITIVDAVVLLSDRQSRSWHDKIGGTVVIEKGAGL